MLLNKLNSFPIISYLCLLNESRSSNITMGAPAERIYKMILGVIESENQDVFRRQNDKEFSKGYRSQLKEPLKANTEIISTTK